jgi:hypothetical protein
VSASYSLRSRRRGPLAALLVTAMIAAVGGATATPAVAGSISDESAIVLSTPATPVTSSSHHKLAISVLADQTRLPPGLELSSIDITVATRSNTESHSWLLNLPNSALKTTKSLSGSIAIPPSKIEPYGAVKVSFTPIGAPVTTTCDAADYTTVQKVHISGTVFFQTRSSGAHPWGSVGGRAKTFTFRTGSTVTDTIGNGASICASPSPNPCFTETAWTVADAAIDLSGTVRDGKPGTIDGERDVTLAKPHGATRTDELSVLSPRPRFRKGPGGKTASLAIRTSGSREAGAATLTSTRKDVSNSGPCGSSQSEQFVTWKAKYVNSEVPLVLHAEIYGDMTIAHALTAFLINDTH